MKLQYTDILRVDELRPELVFVSDSQDVQAIKDDIGPIAREFDSFFVGTRDGDYTEVWGMYGIVPLNGKPATRLV